MQDAGSNENDEPKGRAQQRTLHDSGPAETSGMQGEHAVPDDLLEVFRVAADALRAAWKKSHDG